MRVIPESPEAFREALEVLRSGGIVIHATETCYGIACDLRNEAAVGKLFAIKKRPLNQPVSALFSSVEEAKLFVRFSPKALSLSTEHLPGPLTLVLPIRKDAPYRLHVCSPQAPSSNLSPITYNLSPSIGVRISSHPFAAELVKAFGSPIATTSANLHGKPNPYSVQDIESQLSGGSPLPDLVIDSGALEEAPPSTVVEVIGETVRVLRKGDVRVDERI